MIPTIVPQATTFMAYTPSANILPWQYVTFFLTESATVSFVDYDGNTVTDVVLPAGYHPILVKKITATSVSDSVYIMKHIELN